MTVVSFGKNSFKLKKIFPMLVYTVTLIKFKHSFQPLADIQLMGRTHQALDPNPLVPSKGAINKHEVFNNWFVVVHT